MLIVLLDKSGNTSSKQANPNRGRCNQKSHNAAVNSSAANNTAKETQCCVHRQQLRKEKEQGKNMEKGRQQKQHQENKQDP